MSTIKEPSTLSISVEELTALRAKIQALPKAELHRHLEGSIRLSTVKFYYCVNTLGLSPEVVTDVFSQRGTLNAPGTAVFLNAACAPAERDAVSSLLTVDMSVPANAAQQGVPAEDELVKVVVGRACNFAPEPTLVDFLNKFVNIQVLYIAPFTSVLFMSFFCCPLKVQLLTPLLDPELASVARTFSLRPRSSSRSPLRSLRTARSSTPASSSSATRPRTWPAATGSRTTSSTRRSLLV
jgi:hypothetical protein